MIQTERRSVARHALPVAVCGLCILYVALRLTRGWVPHDEGSIAQSAERLLAGELPHRDFAELYTGGLTYYHAAAFRLLGANLVSLRLAMFVVFAAWVPVLYGLAARVARPAGAALITVLAVAWSVPNYPVSLPSWYNLFFATFGAAALVRYADTGRARWLVAAGACAGVSFLAKLVGLYSVAAGLLFLVYREQWLAARDAAERPSGGGPARAYAALVTLALAGFVGALVVLVRTALHARQVAHFVVPGASLAALLVWRAWTSATSRGASGARTARLFTMVLAFVAGAAVPVAIFLARYVAEGALGDFVQGVFVLPQKRLSSASGRPPSPLTFAAALPLLFVLFAPTGRLSRRWYRVATIAAAVAMLVILFVARARTLPFLAVWFSVRALPTLLSLLGALLLARRPAGREAAIGAGATPDQVAMVLLATMATFTLVQYPFSAPVYFAYVAPTVALAAAALVALQRWTRPASAPASPVRRVTLEAVVVVGYVAFAVLLLHPGYIYDLGYRYHPVPIAARLTGARAGLLVEAPDSAEMAQVTALVSAHARPGDYIYAGPDAPHIYYLARMRNPTTTLFDFFDDSASHDDRVLRAVDGRGVRVAVVNKEPGFSHPISDRLAAELSARFPAAVTTDHYVVRWRE